MSFARVGRAGALCSLLALIASASPAPAAHSARHAADQGPSDLHHGLTRPHRGSRAHGAVIGGQPAADGTFPWLAFIVDFREGRTGQCSGTVVAPNVVLTAAHCAENIETGRLNDSSGYAVVTGDVEWASPSRQVSGVSRVVVYPGFLRGAAVGDAALLVLSTPTTALPIGLAAWPSDAVALQAGKAAVIAGWGTTSYAQRVPTERLQWAETGLQKAAYCETHASPFFPGKELCTIDPPHYETGGCEGDSGGPLISRNPSGGGVVEIGIMSHGYAECSTTRPSVFTRTDLISAWARSWIDAVRPPAASAPSGAVPPAPLAPGTQANPPAPAPWTPANRPGLYVTARSNRAERITARVSGDGRHLVGIGVKTKIKCQRGYTYELRDAWLSYRDNVPIVNHVGATTLTTGSDRYMRAGSVRIYLYFNGAGSLEGRLRIRIPSRDRRAGLCSGTVGFKASL